MSIQAVQEVQEEPGERGQQELIMSFCIYVCSKGQLWMALNHTGFVFFFN